MAGLGDISDAHLEDVMCLQEGFRSTQGMTFEGRADAHNQDNEHIFLFLQLLWQNNPWNVGQGHEGDRGDESPHIDFIAAS